MKTKASSVWMYTAMAVTILFMASCGNSQKKREREAERRAVEQQVPVGTVVESETVVVEVDSLVPDTTKVKRVTPKRTK